MANYGIDRTPVKVTPDEAILPSKTVKAVGARNIADLIARTNDGKKPRLGIHAGGKYAQGAVGLSDDEGIKTGYTPPPLKAGAELGDIATRGYNYVAAADKALSAPGEVTLPYAGGSVQNQSSQKQSPSIDTSGLSEDEGIKVGGINKPQQYTGRTVADQLGITDKDNPERYMNAVNWGAFGAKSPSSSQDMAKDNQKAAYLDSIQPVPIDGQQYGSGVRVMSFGGSSQPDNSVAEQGTPKGFGIRFANQNPYGNSAVLTEQAGNNMRNDANISGQNIRNAADIAERRYGVDVGANTASAQNARAIEEQRMREEGLNTRETQAMNERENTSKRAAENIRKQGQVQQIGEDELGNKKFGIFRMGDNGKPEITDLQGNPIEGESKPRATATTEAMQHLRENPDLAAAYDAKYGAGESKKILGK